ncbi:hypothetical protein ABIB25_001376 [Nakamurella sp. UYEF19]|uniref:hypothetical protein n=1 Tax=Nakamurella sp. UYEF19 TaxID=1756392 RepID=UPI003394414A
MTTTLESTPTASTHVASSSTSGLSADVASIAAGLRMHRSLMAMSKRDPETYAALMEITNSRAVFPLLDRLDDDKALRVEATRDPVGFFDAHGIDVPPGVRLVFTADEVRNAPGRTAKATKGDQRKWFVGVQDSGGLSWGYEGGPAGRGLVCGR